MSIIDFNEENDPDPNEDLLVDTSQASIPTEEDGEQPPEAEPWALEDGEDDA